MFLKHWDAGMLVDSVCVCVCDIMLNHMACATIKQRRSRVVSEKKHTKRREPGSENNSAMIHVHTQRKGEERDIQKKNYTVQSLPPYYSTLVRARSAWLPRPTADTESWRRALLVVPVPVPALAARELIEPNTKGGGEGVHKPDVSLAVRRGAPGAETRFLGAIVLFGVSIPALKEGLSAGARLGSISFASSLTSTAPSLRRNEATVS